MFDYNAPATLTNIDLVNCGRTGLLVFDTNVTKTGVLHRPARCGSSGALAGMVFGAGSHGVAVRGAGGGGCERAQSPSLNVMRAGTPATGGSVKGASLTYSSAVFLAYGIVNGPSKGRGTVAFKDVVITNNVRGGQLGVASVVNAMARAMPSCPRIWAKAQIKDP